MATRYGQSTCTDPATLAQSMPCITLNPKTLHALCIDDVE